MKFFSKLLKPKSRWLFSQKHSIVDVWEGLIYASHSSLYIANVEYIQYIIAKLLGTAFE